MGFYSDWIAKTERLLNAVPYAACSPASREEHGIFSALLAQVKGAKIIRLSGEQADVFIDMPRIDGQDFNWLRMPFLHTYVALDKPFAFHGYVSGYREEPAACVNVRGILVNDWDMTRVPSLKITGAPPGATRILQVVFFVPLADDPGNVHIASLCVAGDKLVIDEHGKDWGTRQRMLTWLIHVVNFLSSPSVKLAQASPDAALQKARARDADVAAGRAEGRAARQGRVRHPAGEGWHHRRQSARAGERAGQHDNVRVQGEAEGGPGTAPPAPGRRQRARAQVAGQRARDAERGTRDRAVVSSYRARRQRSAA